MTALEGARTHWEQTYEGGATLLDHADAYPLFLIWNSDFIRTPWRAYPK